MVGEDDLHDGGEGEEGAEYLYDDWGVDQVDLDFKTGKSLMLDECITKYCAYSVRPEEAGQDVSQSVQSVWSGGCQAHEGSTRHTY